MQSLPNAKKETRKIRGTESEGEYFSHSDVDRQARPNGKPERSESFRTHRNDCEGQSIERIIAIYNKNGGGILGQLIEEFRSQVAVKKQEIERLESRIEQFEAIRKEINSTDDAE